MLRSLGLTRLFWLPNRCCECGTKLDVRQWLDGTTIAFVCFDCMREHEYYLWLTELPTQWPMRAGEINARP